MVVPARHAATLMLVRDAVGAAGDPVVEVCVLRRNLASEFVAGAYVFPGGSVDPGDATPEAYALCDGRHDAGASAVLGVPSDGLAFWVAALRECFEEAGVLVARRRTDVGTSRLLELAGEAAVARMATYRSALNAGRMDFVELCRREGLVLPVDLVHYVSHWITPELSPRRFDTRFFVTVAPPGQDVRHDEAETIASEWVRPADALARYRAGEIDLLPPTVANLTALAGFATSEEVVSWAVGVTAVPAILPVVEFEDGKVLIFRPGDDGYEAAAARAASATASPGVWPPGGRSWFGRVADAESRRGED